ncbi:hypothetical protein Dimus_008871 [Dionaea muscipula]
MTKRGRLRKSDGLARSQPGFVEGANDLLGSADAQIGGKGMMPIKLWGDEEGELVENQVTMASLWGSPYLSACSIIIPGQQSLKGVRETSMHDGDG